MDKADFMLATMAAFPYQKFTPVQIQKFFFLLDRKLSDQSDRPSGLPFFEFRPYAYGPFDSKIYDVLRDLCDRNLVVINGDDHHPRRTYLVTVKGYQEGKDIFDKLAENVQNYIGILGNWILSQSFTQLISSIYDEYPEMQVNSVFRRKER